MVQIQFHNYLLLTVFEPPFICPNAPCILSIPASNSGNLFVESLIFSIPVFKLSAPAFKLSPDIFKLSIAFESFIVLAI